MKDLGKDFERGFLRWYWSAGFMFMLSAIFLGGLSLAQEINESGFGKVNSTTLLEHEAPSETVRVSEVIKPESSAEAVEVVKPVEGAEKLEITKSTDSAEEAAEWRKKLLRQKQYKVGLADRLEVQVWKEPELTREVQVRIDGRISLPIIGDVEAVGLSPEELTEKLEKMFSVVVSEPTVTVILKESRSRRYYMVGKIKGPGEFNMDYPITILQAIARSGGFQDWAETDNVTVVRRENGQEKLLRFNYQSFIKGKTPNENILIMPGDTIIVP